MPSGMVLGRCFGYDWVMFGIFSKSKKASSKKKKTKGKKAGKAPRDKNVAAESESAVEAQPSPPPSSSGSIASAQGKLDQAKANLEAGNFKTKLAPGDRQALIEQAMAVHKEQSKLLDDLDDATRQRLRDFAMEKVFKISDKN